MVHVLIDNFRQEAYYFKTVAELKRHAKKNNLQIKENVDPLRSFSKTFYTT